MGEPSTDHIRQKHPFGCGIAALAMATGSTYDTVHDWITSNWPDDTPPPDFITSGISKSVAEFYLACHGYAWRTLYAGHHHQPWPPAPFAPAHIAMVVQPSGLAHYVAVRADGAVLDPLQDELRRLTDWPRVYNVQGIWSEPLAVSRG